MKKTWFAAIAFILLMTLTLTLAGCVQGSYVLKNAVRSDSSTHLSMRYDFFDGFILTRIKVKEGETKLVTIEVTTDDGALTVYVAKDDDIAGAAFYQDGLSTGTYSTTLTEAGKYTVKAIGAKHKGSFNITWQ